MSASKNPRAPSFVFACAVAACACNARTTVDVDGGADARPVDGAFEARSFDVISSDAAGGCEHPSILTNPVKSGDIPDFVAKLARAYCAADEQICDSLPTPIPQTFDHGDYTTTSPERHAWVAYCLALVRRDPNRCADINTISATPNLKADCEHFFKELAEQRNTSPRFCLEEVGKSYTTDDDVRNCLWKWAVPIYGNVGPDELLAAGPKPPFTELELHLLACLMREEPSAGVDVNDNHRHRCLFELAQRFEEPLICELISNPYDNDLGFNIWSRPNCHQALGAP